MIFGNHDWLFFIFQTRLQSQETLVPFPHESAAEISFPFTHAAYVPSTQTKFTCCCFARFVPVKSVAILVHLDNWLRVRMPFPSATFSTDFAQVFSQTLLRFFVEHFIPCLTSIPRDTSFVPLPFTVSSLLWRYIERVCFVCHSLNFILK